MMRRVLLPGVVVMLLAGCRSAESSSLAPAASASSAPSSPAPLMSMADAKSEELVLHVEGLTCEGCAWQIRETLQKVDGVREVRISPPREHLYRVDVNAPAGDLNARIAET